MHKFVEINILYHASIVYTKAVLLFAQKRVLKNSVL